MYAPALPSNDFSIDPMRRADAFAAPLAGALRFVRGRDPRLRLPTTVKWTFATRCVDRDAVSTGDLRFSDLREGDLLLARIVSVGEHRKIQLAERRSVHAVPGDDVVLVVGNCYAPERFEGVAEIDGGLCDLLAPAGIAGCVRFAHDRCAPPTRLEPLARLLDADGKPINVSRYTLPSHTIPSSTVVVGVFDATGDAGADAVSTSLALGLLRAGRDVSVVRASGTSDLAGHEELDDTDTAVSDFTETGMVTTYLEPPERVERAFETLVGAASRDGADIVVVEFAHGLLHRETLRLLSGPAIANRLDAVVLAAADTPGAYGGASVLRECGLAPLVVSGRITASPLAAIEAERALSVPVHAPSEFRDEELARELLASKATRRGSASVEAEPVPSPPRVAA